jgi:hypothetical protein
LPQLLKRSAESQSSWASAGKGNELTGCTGRRTSTTLVSPICVVSVYSTITIGAAQNHAAGCNQARSTRRDCQLRLHIWHEDFCVQDTRRLLAGAQGVARPNRRPVDARTIEAGYVDIGGHSLRQHSVKRQI